MIIRLLIVPTDTLPVPVAYLGITGSVFCVYRATTTLDTPSNLGSAKGIEPFLGLLQRIAFGLLYAS